MAESDRITCLCLQQINWMIVFICSCDDLAGNVRVSNNRQWQTSVFFHIYPNHWSVEIS